MKALTVIWLLTVALLVACGNGRGTLPAQKWGENIVQVEVRPSTPRVGMNEFLVVVSDARRRPVHDLIVSLRAGDDQKWRQAIQDGRTGVYRRAVRVDDPRTQILQVKLQRRNGEETLLRFPIAAAFEGPSGG